MGTRLRPRHRLQPLTLPRRNLQRCDRLPHERDPIEPNPNYLRDTPLVAERGKVAQCVHPGQEEVRSALKCRERGYSLVHFADGSFGYGEIECAVLSSADRIMLVAELMEGFVVDPHVLGELELADQV